MDKLFKQAVLAAVLLIVVPGLAMAQVTVTLVPSTLAVPPGGSVDIDVRVSGLGAGAAPSVGAFDLNLTFDPTLFSYESTSFGTGLGNPAAMPAEVVTGGPMVAAGALNSIFEVSLLPPATLNAAQPVAFSLFTLRFRSGGQGDGAFGATVTAVGDQDGNPIPIPPIAPVTVRAQSLLEIPTLGTTGFVTLVLLLLGGGLLVLRRMGS